MPALARLRHHRSHALTCVSACPSAVELRSNRAGSQAAGPCWPLPPRLSGPCSHLNLPSANGRYESQVDGPPTRFDLRSRRPWPQAPVDLREICPPRSATRSAASSEVQRPSVNAAARIVPGFRRADSSVEAKLPRDDISGDIGDCETAVHRVRAQQHERVIARHGELCRDQCNRSLQHVSNVGHGFQFRRERSQFRPRTARPTPSGPSTPQKYRRRGLFVGQGSGQCAVDVQRADTRRLVVQRKPERGAYSDGQAPDDETPARGSLFPHEDRLRRPVPRAETQSCGGPRRPPSPLARPAEPHRPTHQRDPEILCGTTQKVQHQSRRAGRNMQRRTRSAGIGRSFLTVIRVASHRVYVQYAQRQRNCRKAARRRGPHAQCPL